jgi:hypothetical protein
MIIGILTSTHILYTIGLNLVLQNINNVLCRWKTMGDVRRRNSGTTTGPLVLHIHISFYLSLLSSPSVNIQLSLPPPLRVRSVTMVKSAGVAKLWAHPTGTE